MSNSTVPQFWTLQDWANSYRAGARPQDLLPDLLSRLSTDDPAWISLISADALTARLQALDPSAPLYGIPFAVKDNIDAAGLPTSCACPDFAYLPDASALAVAKLEAAGAVVIGKTNLDQFATGLVGTRSPYGAVPNAFSADHVSGGSSSGSASVVARGLVPFALGTDTAGSGRVPAGHNNLVGLKPTRGLVSTRGLVPACRTLDCITVLALSVDDAASVLAQMQGYDATDAYSRKAGAPPTAWPARPVLGIPAQTNWFGDRAAEAAYQAALSRLTSLGVDLRMIDFQPLWDVAALLYDGPWVAERYAAIEAVMRDRPDIVHPVVRSIIEKARTFTAADGFKAEYRRMDLARRAEDLMTGLDGLLVPTAPTLPTLEEVMADPVGVNSRMGLYTNFVNLLDWSAIALPGGMREDGLPAGITLIAPAWNEARLIEFGRLWQAASPWKRGTSNLALPQGERVVDGRHGHVTLAVVGAHLSGMPLNGQLTERGAVLLESTLTSAAYRLYALPGTTPPKPGLLRTGEGMPIAVELWDMPVAHYGSFVALIPPPLGIGTLELVDGRHVQGFLCEAWATRDAADITSLGGWRAYMRLRAQNAA
ncbi:MAG: allophanate hydrolase [Niveispirillum sp.]|uniref:allophanate hydrolase n=1 Tax=Niveispirillum sp. TaxID=1917217 RepID=UPI003BA53CDA